MNNKFLFAGVAGIALMMIPGSGGIAQGQEGGSVLDSIIKSMGSSKEDRSDRYSRDEGNWSDHEGHHSDDHDRRSKHDSNEPEVIVRRAYQDILNREPDEDGMRTYRSKIIDDNWSEKDVRNDLRRSQERAGLKSEAVDQIIRRAYQDVLRRDPDQSGLATYRAKMLYDGWSERDVRSDLKKSSERREIGDVSNEQAQQIVRRAYRDVLGREPDSGSSVYIEKVMRNHWSQDDVATALRKSPEYKQKHRK